MLGRKGRRKGKYGGEILCVYEKRLGETSIKSKKVQTMVPASATGNESEELFCEFHTPLTNGPLADYSNLMLEGKGEFVSIMELLLPKKTYCQRCCCIMIFSIAYLDRFMFI